MGNDIKLKHPDRVLPAVERDINGDGKLDRIESRLIDVDQGHNVHGTQFVVEPAIKGRDGILHKMSSAPIGVAAFGSANEWFDAHDAKSTVFYRDQSVIPFTVGSRVVTVKNGKPEVFTITGFVVGIKYVEEKDKNGEMIKKPQLAQDQQGHIMKYVYAERDGGVVSQASLDDVAWAVGKDGVLDLRHITGEKKGKLSPAEKVFKPLFDQVKAGAAKRSAITNYQMGSMVVDSIATTLKKWEQDVAKTDPTMLAAIKQDPILVNNIKLALTRVAGLDPEDSIVVRAWANAN